MTCDVAIIGGGPAGLAAGIEASTAGAQVLLISENNKPGGQLFKQIHKFFGSSKHHAGVRGYNIGTVLLNQAEKSGVKTCLNSLVYSVFGDRSLGLIKQTELVRVKAKTLILCGGASEKIINFPGWTLPGVMGAGAAQTIVNIYRVLPGKRFLMIGSGNVGLVVSYQLLQAGADVVGVIEMLPQIGGYGVHASKLRRMGVPILTSHTITRAHGREEVEAATITALDRDFSPLPGTEKRLDVDVICLAVGLKPNLELPLLTGCKTAYFPTLGGRVPIHDENMETTEEGVYVAGDTAGVEEASVAIETGRLAGIAAAEKHGYLSADEAEKMKLEVRSILNDLRRGPFGIQRNGAKQKLTQIAASLRSG